MMNVTAFYTLVQLIPDKLRDERINIAVILQSPEKQFAGIKVRKYLNASINRIFPFIDAETIRLIVRGFARDFLPYTGDFTGEQPLLLRSDREIFPFDPQYLFRYKHGYSVLHFAEPRPMSIAETQSLTAKLEQLYTKLVADQELVRETRNITKEILETSVINQLYRRKIRVVDKPPTFQGLHWPNKFDALRNKSNRRHLQFISFDLTEAPIAQAKAFLASIDDLRQADDKYIEDEFACILQPPRTKKELQEDYFKAISTFGAAGVVTFQNYPDDIERLALGLESDNGLRSVAG